MKRMVRIVSLSLLLLVFLAGNTGITFFVHTCGSSHTKDVFVYREIFHQHMDCCCEENAGDHSSSPTGDFSDDDCCRISHLFVKAAITELPALDRTTVPVNDVTLYLPVVLNRYEQESGPKASFIPFLDHSPPPLSGVSLVYFLHQIRIPAPAC